MPRHFIVIEGLIGVGKTSLARLLESEWGARLVLEPAATNPFLESFYRDPDRYGLPVQIYYLLERWRQQEVIAQQDLTRMMLAQQPQLQLRKEKRECIGQKIINQLKKS